MSKHEHHQQHHQQQPKPPVAIVEKAAGVTEEPAKAPPAPSAVVEATVETAPPVVDARRVSAKSDLVTITPRATIGRFRFGPDWYSIQAGKETKLPRAVVDHLRERGHV